MEQYGKYVQQLCCKLTLHYSTKAHNVWRLSSPRKASGFSEESELPPRSRDTKLVMGENSPSGRSIIWLLLRSRFVTFMRPRNESLCNTRRLVLESLRSLTNPPNEKEPGIISGIFIPLRSWFGRIQKVPAVKHMQPLTHCT